MTTLPPDPALGPRWDPPQGAPPGTPSSPPPTSPPPGYGIPAWPVEARPGPVASPVAAPTRRRGRALFWTALSLLVVGAVLLLGAFGGMVANLDMAENRTGVDVPGARSVTLEAGRRYTLYVVRPSGTHGTDPRITLTAPDGTQERIISSTLGVTEDVAGETSTPYGDVTAAVSGTYELRAEPIEGANTAEGTRVTIGNGIDTTAENVGLGLFLLGIPLVLAGLGVGTGWLIVRRRPAG